MHLYQKVLFRILASYLRLFSSFQLAPHVVSIQNIIIDSHEAFSYSYPIKKKFFAKYFS